MSIGFYVRLRTLFNEADSLIHRTLPAKRRPSAAKITFRSSSLKGLVR
jgi:hypothetical protein